MRNAWEGRPFEEYLELVDERVGIPEGAWYWGIGDEGEMIRVPAPRHINCRCMMIPKAVE